MKKIISGIILKEKMKEAVNLLCDTVKTTLGPKCNNIIIDHSNYSPFITNDGVTIAENIESDDPVINTILELAKEASINTNELSGDGTTTTLVLLQSIFNEGIKLIDEGINPLILKRELDNSLDIVIEKINKLSRKPNMNEMLNIAITSSNDFTIGKNIFDVYNKIKIKDVINIKESNNDETIIKYNKGYLFESNLISNYYFRDNNQFNLKDCFILLIDNNLNYIEQIDSIINEIIKSKNNLVILANDYNDNFINDILGLFLDNIANIFLFKTPEYGNKQRSILNDISAISNANVIDNIDNITLNDLGKLDYIKFNDKETIIEFKMNNKIKERVMELEEISKNINTSIDKDFINKELAMFNNGTASIYVGAPTKLERQEKIMRYIDALCAIDSTKNGILPGCGIILDKISNSLDNNVNKILKISLKSPMKQILTNAALDYEDISNNIINNNYSNLYNVVKDCYEDINNTNVIDSTSVIINSLKNACSIASMLLTTSSLVINEYTNKTNKINDYNEL